MQTIKAIYPGTFDPLTNGHLDLIARGSKIVGELVVAILRNAEKGEPLFTVDERREMIFEATRQFARSWRPTGVAAVGIELVYLSTDPPIRLLRRVIPPLRLGSISLDLSIVILLLGILALYWVVLSLG